MIQKSILMATLALCAVSANAEKTEIAKMEPPMWWTGMQSSQLQITVSGKNIRDAVPSINYPGVKIDSVARLDSPNYQFIYLTIDKDTRPGKIDISFSAGKKKIHQSYELLPRDSNPDSYIGFDSSDVLYLIMPDRFAKSDSAQVSSAGLNFPTTDNRNDPSARHGGNIKGIIEHLDYLQQLGITAIWLTPVLENDMPGGSYHGYATTDYYRIDLRFGTNEEYRELIAECHRRGIKVVMDMIFNHCGLYHPWMADMPAADWINSYPSPNEINALKAQMEGGKVKTPESFKQTNFRLNTNHDPYVSQYDLDLTVNGWFVTAMPDLNQRNNHLMTYLIQNSIWWIEYSKINGIRMDTYPYADMNAMAQWNKAVLQEYPNFNIVGESWLEDPASISFMQRDSRLNPTNTQLPTVMDFPLFITAQKAFSEQTQPWGEGLNRLYNHLALDVVYNDPSHILTFLDNHDTDRFLPAPPDNLDQWKQAQTFLLTTRGIPQIYYGTELLMNGTKKITDGNIRLDMPGGFPGDKNNAFTTKGRTPSQNEAFNFLSRLLHWRKDNTAVTRGSLRHFMPTNSLYVYERRSYERRTVVILNGTDRQLTDIDMSRYAEILHPGDSLTDIITDKKITINKKMTFPPRAILILE